MSTAPPTQRDGQIVEIRRISSRPGSTAGDLTPELARVPRRHDPTVALLLVLSVVALVVGIATTSIIAWLAGVVSLVTAFSVDTRPERELRDLRRSRELDQLRRRHRAVVAKQLGQGVSRPRPERARGRPESGSPPARLSKGTRANTDLLRAS